jgi:hypothetical protein
MASHHEHQSLHYLKTVDRTRNEIQKNLLLLEHRRMLLESSAQLLQEHQGLRVKCKTLRADWKRLITVGFSGRFIALDDECRGNYGSSCDTRSIRAVNHCVPRSCPRGLATIRRKVFEAYHGHGSSALEIE